MERIRGREAVRAEEKAVLKQQRSSKGKMLVEEEL